MDPQFEMVLRMQSDLRQLVVDENIETRKQVRESLMAILAEQKITNGRVNKLEKDISRIDTLLDERTSDMVCAEHSATFRQIGEKVDALIDCNLPTRVEVLERTRGDVGGDQADDTDAPKTPAQRRTRNAAKAAVGTVGVLALAWAIVDIVRQILAMVKP